MLCGYKASTMSKYSGISLLILTSCALNHVNGYIQMMALHSLAGINDITRLSADSSAVLLLSKLLSTLYKQLTYLSAIDLCKGNFISHLTVSIQTSDLSRSEKVFLWSDHSFLKLAIPLNTFSSSSFHTGTLSNFKAHSCS